MCQSRAVPRFESLLSLRVKARACKRFIVTRPQWAARPIERHRPRRSRFGLESEKKASELSVNWRQHNKHNERYFRMTPRCSAVISRASCNRSFTAASLYAGRAFTQTQQLYTDIHAHVSHSYHLSFFVFYCYFELTYRFHSSCHVIISLSLFSQPGFLHQLLAINHFLDDVWLLCRAALREVWGKKWLKF